MATPFLFKPLASGHIRLIEIAAGDKTDPLHCKISEWPLADAPQYEALSYAWGAQDRPVSRILVNDQSFGISTELELALRHLRQANATRTMWIDAICIDQANTEERNSQVTVMRDIYRGAGHVIAWLGEESHDSGRAMRFLKEMAKVRNDQLRGHWINGVQQGEPSSDGSEAGTRGCEDEQLNSEEGANEHQDQSETDSEAGENDHFIPPSDSTDDSSGKPNGRLQKTLSFLRERWTRWMWDLQWKWESWSEVIRHPLKSWFDRQARNKAWKTYVAEWDKNYAREGHVITGYPVLYYDFGIDLDDLFSDERQLDWEALDALFERPWFSRTWVVQEVWNSADCTIQCGSSTLKWKKFALAMDFQEGWDDMGFMVKQTKRWAIWPILKRRYGLAIHIAKKRLHGSRLSDLLWNLWDREATDPRDKVFAVLGLLGDAQNAPLPSVDYSKSLEDVYREAAAFIIGKDRKLDLLLAATGLGYSQTLPSWVPDWRRTGNDHRPALFINGSKMNILSYYSGSTDMVVLHGHGYSASGDYEPSVSFSSDLSILTVRGLVLDTIALVGPLHEDDAEATEIIDAAHSTIDRFASQQTSERLQSMGVDDKEMGRILRAGTPLPPKYRYNDPDEEGQVIENIMKHRRFFVTKEGHLCIGPAEASEQDVVVIIAGCNFPMILRPKGDRYNLVGEAYVHHNMAGESLKKTRFFGFIKQDPDWMDISIE